MTAWRWIARWRALLACLACVCLGGWWPGVAQAASPIQGGHLLWLTGEITPGARTALLQAQAQAQGLRLTHIDFPLRGGNSLTEAQQQSLNQALAQADAVWIDAPHASVEARMHRLLDEALARTASVRTARTVVWVGPEGSQLPQADDTASGLAEYLQSSGVANVAQALRWQRARLAGQPRPELAPVVRWPTRGLYHPDAPGILRDAGEGARWQSRQTAFKDLPVVVVLVHRYHFVNGQTEWLDRWLRLFASRGLVAYAVFGQQVDAAGLEAMLSDPAQPGQAWPRVLVSHQLLSQGAALQALLKRWDRPLLITQPFRAGDAARWASDTQGIGSSDVPFYLAQPEGAGGIDPIVVTAHGEQGRTVELIERQAQAVVDKASRLVRLQTRPRAEQQLVVMVYNYPPGGSHFGASFLNVPRSLEVVSTRLQEAGYVTQPLPEAEWITRLQPLLAAYYPQADLRALLEQDQAAALPLADYLAWWRQQPIAVRERIEAQWGPPERSRYVLTWQGQKVFVIPRLQRGRLAVLPQPPREETLHQGQNPFMHRSRTPLSHHYLAVYLWARQADALIHFGTHGTQEWAPGKSRGLDVNDDALLPLGDVPVVYPYIVDNLGEALTAKRRGRAVMVSHRTPVMAPAGFEAGMAHMHELMHEWETVDAGPTKVALEKQLLDQFVAHRLHRDLGWAPEAIAANFEGFLELLHPYLDTLAQSAQPRGLAVFGRVPEAALRQQTILQALRKPLIEALGEDIDEAFLIDHSAVAMARPARWLQVALKDADAASRLDLRPPEPEGPVPNRAARKPIDSVALHALALRAQALDKLMATEGEVPGLLRALGAGFVEAAYGGDPIRNPDSLPTGRNLTGLDPARLPTKQAHEVAQGLFNDWLKAWRSEHGQTVPERLALSLWAGETLRHQGIMEAQALVALGVRPVWDASGRPTSVQLIPLSELGRPRVDVLLSVTGSYRDQFPALMALVDQAVRLVAQADEAAFDNPVARHTAQVRQSLLQAGVAPTLAQTLAQARVFGNVAGDYGTGLSEAVQSNELQRDDARLGSLFLQRMSQPYIDGEPVSGLGTATMVQAFGAHLRQTQAALMSRSSHLYAMVTSDDPFQYLGGLSAAARQAGRSEGLALYVNQLHDTSEAHTESARRAIALEMQARYLHPGWLQGQVAEGYSGTLQVLKAVQFAWGWQATAPDTVRDDHWQAFHDVLVNDRHKLGVPEWLASHPQAYAQALERLIQAARMGHWHPDADTRQALARRYREMTRAAALPSELEVVRDWARQEAADGVDDAAATSSRQADAPPRAHGTVPRGLTVGEGLNTPIAPPPAAAPLQAPPQGWVLAPQPAQPPRPDALTPWLETGLAWCTVALWACAGAVWQWRQPRRVGARSLIPIHPTPRHGAP